MDNTPKKVLIVDGDGDAAGLVRKVRSLDTILRARNQGCSLTEPIPLPDWLTQQHSDDGPRDHTVYVGDADAKGKIAPVKTNMAARFPLMSRRERRERQREEKRAAKRKEQEGWK